METMPVPRVLNVTDMPWCGLDLRAFEARQVFGSPNHDIMVAGAARSSGAVTVQSTSTVRSWPPEVCTVAATSVDRNGSVRLVRLQVSFGQVSIQQPMRQSPNATWLVRVWEIDPPLSAEPFEWILPSDAPVVDAADALRLLSSATQRRPWLS